MTVTIIPPLANGINWPPVPQNLPLLAWGDGSFMRTSQGAVQSGAATFDPFAANNVRREVTYNANPRLSLIEHQRANEVIRTDHTAGWVDVGVGVPVLGLADPAGGTTAWSLAYAAGVNNRSQIQMSNPNLPNSTIVTLSVWARIVSGGGQFRLNLLTRANVDSLSPDFVATGTWQRFVWRAQDVGIGAQAPIYRLRNGSGGAATTIEFWNPQCEIGRVESSEIPIPGSAAVTFQPDVATWLAAEVPQYLREAPTSMPVAPGFEVGDLDNGDERWLLSFSDNLNGLRVLGSGGALALQVLESGVVAVSQNITPTRYAEVDVAWNPYTGELEWDGNSVFGSAWTWPAGALRVGGIVGGTGEWRGRLDLPVTR